MTFNDFFLNLDWHFRCWTVAMVQVKRTTMFPNPKHNNKTYMDIS